MSMGRPTPLSDWRKQQFLEWLCTVHADRDPPTMTEFAAKIGSTNATLTGWKRDAEFLAEWERRYRLTVGSPEKAQTVIQRLYETAEDRTDPRQVAAAKAFLEAIDAVKPHRIDVTVSKAAKELSEEELNELLAAAAAKELEERQIG